MDWNNDGHLDILSGCYWTREEDGGFIQFLAGNGSLDFAEAKLVENVEGGPLLNTHLDKNASNGMASNQIETICTHPHAVDYDNDGDLDIVNGCFGMSFYYYENQGTPEKSQLTVSPIKLPIQSTSNHAAPHLADWDGDGDLDLLSGASQGGVILSENTGTRAEPIWSEFTQLVPPTYHTTQSPSQIQPSASTRVWVMDWNGDGDLDLIVGDSVTLSSPKSGMGNTEYQRRKKEHESQMAELAVVQQELMPKYQAAMESGEELAPDLQQKWNDVSRKIAELFKSTEEFEDNQETGHVWLYVRK